MTTSTCLHVTLVTLAPLALTGVTGLRPRANALSQPSPSIPAPLDMMQAYEMAPPRKRARTSRNDNSDDPPSLEKDEEFWYDDGTLILIAANVEFRVYRGPLATHSPVFRDMLALPQPPSSQSTSSAYDASNTSSLCPTVHVTDSPVDLRYFCAPSLLEEPSSTFRSLFTHASN